MKVNPECARCGLPETLAHALFTCAFSKKQASPTTTPPPSSSLAVPPHIHAAFINIDNDLFDFVLGSHFFPSLL
ncbi:hypothetical protein TorRG33x02_037220 [Trema orientale]|uniref:Reverse transcriptase zinc-binding domain-containing protein n=1 Tax=Trema orientale TaxID=63057 RepID=A0A2P5FS64_TREOI|nr:hypothetical protein TorRG33x02_037220 [Trema orientale]